MLKPWMKWTSPPPLDPITRLRVLEATLREIADLEAPATLEGDEASREYWEGYADALNEVRTVVVLALRDRFETVD